MRNSLIIHNFVTEFIISYGMKDELIIAILKINYTTRITSEINSVPFIMNSIISCK